MSEENNTVAFDSLTKKEQEDVMLRLHGDIMHQLLQRPRFQLFLEANYEIKPRIDDEERNVGFVVMERPEAEVSQHLMNALKKAKEKDIVIADQAMINKLKM